MSSPRHLPSTVHSRSSPTHSSVQLPVRRTARLWRPITTLNTAPCPPCRYYHRCINIPKLVDVHFTGIPSNSTLARMIRLHKLPDRPRLLDQGLREMEERDVPQVADLFSRYMERFGMVPVMNEDEVRHQFLSGLGEGPRGGNTWKIKREGQVVWTYVVEVSPSRPVLRLSREC